MRLHRTYILRLLVDTEISGVAPELRGALQAIEDQQIHLFQSSAGLLSLLQTSLSGAAQDDCPIYCSDNEP